MIKIKLLIAGKWAVQFTREQTTPVAMIAPLI
jgi:hypothetical protein